MFRRPERELIAFATRVAKLPPLEEEIPLALFLDLCLDGRRVDAGEQRQPVGRVQRIDDVHRRRTALDLGDDEPRFGVAGDAHGGVERRLLARHPEHGEIRRRVEQPRSP